MLQIPDIKEVISIINDNNKITNDIIKGSMKTISSIIDMTKDTNLKKQNKKLDSIAKSITAYIDMINNIISILSTPYVKGKDLKMILGYMDTDIDTNGKIVKLDKPVYTNVEALTQINVIMNNLTKNMTDLSKFKINFIGISKVKNNIKLLSKHLDFILKSFITNTENLFSKEDIDKIISVFLGKPGNIIENLEDIDKSQEDINGNNKILKNNIIKKNKKITEGNKPGIIELITGVMNLLSSLNNFQMPNFLKFNLRLKLFNIQLELTIKEIVKTLAKSFYKNQILQDFCKFITSDDNNLFDAINQIYMVQKKIIEMSSIENIMYLYFANKYFVVFGDVMELLANMVINEELGFTKLSDTSLDNRIRNAKRNIEEITNIFEQIIMMIRSSIIINLSEKLLISSLKSLKNIILSINNIFDEELKNIDNSNISNIADLIDDLINLQIKLIKLASLSIPAIISILLCRIFIKNLVKFLNDINDKISQINNTYSDTSENIENILNTINLLKSIQLSIIILGILVIPAIIATSINIIFVHVLILFILVLNKLSHVIKIKSYKKIKNINKFILYLILVEISIIAMAILAEKSFEAMLEDIKFLLLLISFFIIIRIITKIISKIVEQSFGDFIKIILIIGIIIAISGMLILLGNLAIIVNGYFIEYFNFFGILTLIIISFLVIALLLGTVLTVIWIPTLIGIVGLIVLIGALLGVCTMLVSVANSADVILKNKKSILDLFDFLSIIILKIIKFATIGLGAAILIPAMNTKLKLIKKISKIVRKLLFISLIKLNKENIENNIETLGSVFNKLKTIQIYRINKKYNKNLKQANKLIRSIFKTINILKKIQKIQLDDDKIINNIEIVYGTIRKIDEKIKELDPLKENKTGLFFGNTKRGFKKSIERMVTHKKQLKKSEKILAEIYNIISILDHIQNIEVDIKKIISNIGVVYNVIWEIDKNIKNLDPIENNEDNNTSSNNTRKGFMSYFRENIARKSKLKKSEKILAEIYDIVYILDQIQDIKLSKKNIKDNIISVYNIIDEVDSIIKEKSKETEYANSANANAIDAIISINNSLKELSNIDQKKLNNTKQNLNNYIKFLEKIRTINIDKLQKTVNLFTQMTKFSESISGNFNKLAESLNENIMPMLEELKEIMEKIPSGLKEGFTITNETLVATSPNPIPYNNMNNIVKASNPNMNDQQIENESNRRLEAQMKNQNQMVSSKLDELITLLSGEGRIKTIQEY